MDNTGIDNRLEGNVLITGGAGTLGKAIIRRATVENWPAQFTIYSRDPIKHMRMRRDYPNVRYVVGDIGDYDGLYRTMLGHTAVIHAGAQKHIDVAESNVIDCIQTNVMGSMNVAQAAVQAGVSKVVGLSTDKVAHSVNCYGHTKALLEYIFREYNQLGLTTFHLCRYGNVLGSNGSVLRVWREMLARDGYVTATDPDMTRFWITEDEAVDLVLAAYHAPAGTTVIPLAPALDMRRFAEYTMPEGTRFEYAGLRPGEKMHEELITAEESKNLQTIGLPDGIAHLWPQLPGGKSLYYKGKERYRNGYTSDNPAHWLTRDELLSMIGEA